MRTYFANVQLFSDPGPSGSGFGTGEVKIELCPKCGKASFDVPKDVRMRFVR
jgi:hypothetical protein